MTALFGRTVLITGAAGGFGQCLVRQLLVAGSQVVLADLDRRGAQRADDRHPGTRGIGLQGGRGRRLPGGRPSDAGGGGRAARPVRGRGADD